MPIKTCRSALLLLLSLSSTAALADEGQWLPNQMPQLKSELKRVGIEVPAKQLADLTAAPMNAVVGLGYCTASFVSPKGLVLTNHHCAYGAIQYNSRSGRDYMTDGFLARRLQDELSAGPQERLYITEALTDVSEQVKAGTAELDDGYQRHQLLEQNQKALIKACEADPNYRCSVRSYHGGLEYYLLKQLIIRDVRLVYAPPESVGAFGGDIDNFEYPRHSGDFTFLRAYVAPDGSPAAYSEDNVPYQPAGYLPIARNGVRAGDGILVAGYPGRTSRHQLQMEMAFAADWLYPTQAGRYQARIDAIESQTDDAVRIAYAATRTGYANRMKKLHGLLDGFRKTDIEGIKRLREAALDEYLAAQGQHALLASLQAKLVEQQRQYQQTFYLNNAQSGALLSVANQLYRWAKEQEKPDAEREPGFQERDRKLFQARMARLDQRFMPSMDRQLWQMDIDAYLAQSQRDEVLDGQLARLNLDNVYRKTELGSQAQRLAWMDRPAADFETSKDPLLAMAVALYPGNEQRRKASKTLQGELTALRPALMAAMLEWYAEQGRPIYPDANGTLRISYGTVDGYQAADALYKQPFTRVEGILEKHTGQAPFNAPPEVLQAIRGQSYGELAQHNLNPKRAWYCWVWPCAQAKGPTFDSVPVNFLSSADTTGGNSGSPVLNGEGQLVGLNFDSTYESITKDWYFNPRITRAIHVDIRFVLWMLSEVDNAEELLNELTLK
ncbi:S46 family peptidase [Ferrimonas marina]|uniref:Dipeptidyl-peptidase n=1 Tax=Ferrimonas marina TaxID=299255 RepID=A0A1M5X6M4_9GAMM|nr:S46 family peptidase [Ferrimonas marina]SHH95426.1 Peptidase S46 [Ferrimonas marina]